MSAEAPRSERGPGAAGASVEAVGLLHAAGPRPEDVVRGPVVAPGPLDFDPEAVFGGRNHRPLDRTGQLTAAAVGECLENLEACRPRPSQERTALVVGTALGSIGTISRFDRRAQTAGPLYAKPMDFANSVINAAGGQAAIWHDLRGVNTTCCGGTTSGVLALLHGCDLLRSGRADLVVAGGVDEHCEEIQRTVSSAGWIPAQKLGEAAVFFALAPVSEGGREGPAAGDGAAVRILGGASRAAARGGTEGNTDGDRLAGALVRAVDAAVAEAEVGADTLRVVSAGTGTGSDTDPAEQGALERWPALAQFRVKERTGECLGASGALQLLPFRVWSDGGEVPGWPDDGDRLVGLLTAVDRLGMAVAMVVETRRDG